jgi:hypothetical protein
MNRLTEFLLVAIVLLLPGCSACPPSTATVKTVVIGKHEDGNYIYIPSTTQIPGSRNAQITFKNETEAAHKVRGFRINPSGAAVEVFQLTAMPGASVTWSYTVNTANNTDVTIQEAGGVAGRHTERGTIIIGP